MKLFVLLCLFAVAAFAQLEQNETPFDECTGLPIRLGEYLCYFDSNPLNRFTVINTREGISFNFTNPIVDSAGPNCFIEGEDHQFQGNNLLVQNVKCDDSLDCLLLKMNNFCNSFYFTDLYFTNEVCSSWGANVGEQHKQEDQIFSEGQFEVFLYSSNDAYTVAPIVGLLAGAAALLI